MVKKRGEIENWLKRIFFSGDKNSYVVLVKHRCDGEEILKPIPGHLIRDIRGGYIYVESGETIPYHRVMEIRKKDGELVYSRARR